jgi:hypothetical protein
MNSAAANHRSGGLNGFNVVRIEGIPSGGGTGYVGTIEGLHVFTVPMEPSSR